LGNKDKISQLEAGGEDLFAEGGEVVPVVLGDFLDEAMEAEAFEEAGDLAAIFRREVGTEVFVLKAVEVKLAAGEGFKKLEIVGSEEVEAGVGALLLAEGLAKALEFIQAGAWVFQGGKELQVTPVGGGEQFA
jgi:hypothetical protein